MTLLYAGDIDVFIVNRTIYERYAKVGAFMSLDEIAPELGIDVSGHQDLILAVEDIDDLMSSEAEGIPGKESCLAMLSILILRTSRRQTQSTQMKAVNPMRNTFMGFI